MDNPRPEGEDKARLARMIDSLLYATPEEGVDLCFSFDTTGSMYSCLEKVRANITQTVTKLMADIPNLRVGTHLFAVLLPHFICATHLRPSDHRARRLL